MKILGHNMMESIFSKLVLTFLLVMVPIYIIGAVIFSLGFRSVKDGITKYHEYKMDFFLSSLENDIQQIRTLQFDFFEDTNLLRLSNLPNDEDYYETRQSIQLLQQRMYTIKNSSEYIEEVEVYILNINKKISTLNGVNELDMEEYSFLNEINYSNEKIIKKVDGKMTILGVNPRPNNSENDPTFIFRITISQKQLKNSLQKFDGNDEGGSFISDNDNYSVLFMPEDEIKIDNNAILSNVQSTKVEFENPLQSKKIGGNYETGHGSSKFLILYLESNYLDMTLFKYIPTSSLLSQMNSYGMWFWTFTSATVLIIILYAFYMKKFIHKPLIVLVESFKKVEKGDTGISIKHTHADEFRYLFSGFNDMVEKLNHLIDQVYKQKIMTQRAELKQLQSQINPHFLFNSFFILKSKIKIGDTDNAVLFSDHLGKYFEFITRSSKEEVTLSMEYEHAKVYANIQMMRFSNRIKVYFDELPEDLKSLVVPRLILQPIIENSFKYGLEDMTENAILSIKIFKEGYNVRIETEDNGKGMDESKINELNKWFNENDKSIETTGIINIHRRLQLFFGNDSGIHISKSSMGGIKVVLLICGKNND